jgi:hypothetical protein
VTGARERIRIVLGNSSLAAYPQGGGHWSVFLQYLLGLGALGHDVLLLEVLTSTGDRAADERLASTFFARLREYGLEECGAILVHDKTSGPPTPENCRPHGKTRREIEEFSRTADLLWNFCCALRRPLLSLFRRRVLIDLDPGHLQVSALSCALDLHEHDVFLTVGSRINESDCEIPRLGLSWQPFTPFVYLPLWRTAPDPEPRAPFTSITHWTWEEIWLGQRVLAVGKRAGYLRYLELPRKAPGPFELAVNLHPDDATGDRELLLRHGWRLVHPYDVAATPGEYRNYIARSRAEIQCPKPIFRELRTGWFSDRSACYLASGRPVLAEDTGLGGRFPTGNGLLAFRDLDELVAGVDEIDSHYERHSRAARAFAEEFLDSSRCLSAMIESCGRGNERSPQSSEAR